MLPFPFRRLALLAIWGLPLAGFAQSQPATATEAPAGPTVAEAAERQWYLRDPQLDKVPGIGATRAYDELLKNRIPTPVVVAVIDSGIDTAHVDLKPVLWVNRDEIAGNGLDDDKNGYIDDVHGWNFLGGIDGRNVGPETLEMTRLVAAGRRRFAKQNPRKVKKADRADFDLYQQAEKAYKARLKEASTDGGQLQTMVPRLSMMFELLKQDLRVERLDTATLRTATFSDAKLQRAGEGMLDMMRSVGAADDEATLAELSKALDHEQKTVNKSLALDFDPRSDIVKDDPNDLTQRYYGNHDLYGTDPLHGTHVAGIIAAARDNNLGVQGIAGSPVQIMAIRAVPDGDERDKDIANAIRYAVDNGAQIINMSFGKEFSPQRPVVEEAYKYAAQRNVLLVHAAGNEDDDLDVTPHYPAAQYIDGSIIPNLLTVGASGPEDNGQLVASFSNFSQKSVDVFAPGVNIYNTLPGSTYGNESGTSMAAPVTAGVAAVLKSYFPGLSAADLKRIIMQSAQVHHTQVKVPGSSLQVDFSRLSKSGGIVDLYEAVKLAQAEGK